MTKYDDASWHYGNDFPDDLPEEAGGTHIGMFLAWAVLSGRASAFLEEEMASGLAALKGREVTPGAFLLDTLDGKLVDEELNDEANGFAQAYYAKNLYYEDLDRIFARELPSLYHMPDDWLTFEKLRPVLDKRFDEWTHGKLPTLR